MPMIKNKRILCVGGAGSIGSELVRQLVKKNKVFVVDQNESGFFEIQQETGCFGRVGDIRDKGVVFDVFSDFKPQIVINCAALKHVPYSQRYPDEYVKTNIIGNLNLIEEAKKWECLEKFIFISTDKAVSTNSVMGATKRCAELMTVNMGKRFVAVRFGNVIGSRGSLYTIWDKQIKKGEMMTVTDKRMERYFMTIKEACELVIEASKENNGILVLDMGKPKKIIDLAREYAKKNNYNPFIKIIGIRDGETLTEELMFEEEKKRAIKKGRYYKIES